MPSTQPGVRPWGLPRHLVWPVRVDPSGTCGPTPKQSRGPRWRRTSHGLFVPADVDRTVDQRIVEAAAVLPGYGGVTGWAALRWIGGGWFGGTRGADERPVTLAVASRSIRPQGGIATSEERLGPTEIVVVRGVRVTTALRSLFFEMRYAATETEAVQAADLTAYHDLVSKDELLDFIAVTAGWTGMGRFRTGAGDMDENAWSPPEVTMRRMWEHLAGLPRPLCNRPVFDLAGHHLGTPDLIDPVAGVIGEYNGAHHFERARRALDIRREAAFRAAGLEGVEMQADDLADPWPFLARLRQAYARAQRLPASERRWTVELPPWWVPTFTVAQRRALDDEQRRRLLALRLRAG
jgi:hypothetical protein